MHSEETATVGLVLCRNLCSFRLKQVDKLFVLSTKRDKGFFVYENESIMDLLLELQDSVVDFRVAGWHKSLFVFKTFEIVTSCPIIKLFYFFSFLFLRTFHHSVNTNRQCVVHQLLDHLCRNCLHVLTSIVKLRLTPFLHSFCLITAIVVNVLAHSLKCVFFWEFLCSLQLDNQFEISAH